MHLKKMKVGNTVSKRHLAESEVFAILGAEKSGRNYILLKLMYASALRISEVISLRWRDFRIETSAGILHVLGKGAKDRFVTIQGSLFAELIQYKESKKDRERFMKPLL
jgi:site-specific recombinase XerD